MASTCDRIRGLGGQTLYTTKQGQPFEVAAVDGDAVRIRIGAGRGYATTCGQFDEARRLGLMRRSITSRELDRRGIARGRTAYAAAILRAILDR